jgi:hypothetical protein
LRLKRIRLLDIHSRLISWGTNIACLTKCWSWPISERIRISLIIFTRFLNSSWTKDVLVWNISTFSQWNWQKWWVITICSSINSCWKKY